MISLYRLLVRTLSFLREEIAEILRQPRLMLTLVVGPFLILLLVGLGYRNDPGPLRTMFVISNDNPLRTSIEEFSKQITAQFDFKGITDNESEALSQLRRGELDLVAVAPEDAYETVRSNNQAVFTLYHSEIDPFQVNYVSYLGRIYVEEANRYFLQSITQQGQSDSTSIEGTIHQVRMTTQALGEASQRGDAAAVRQRQEELGGNVRTLEGLLGAGGLLLSNIPAEDGTGSDAVSDNLTAIRQNINAVTSAPAEDVDLQELERIDADLVELESNLQTFQRMDARILVSPFRSETQSIAKIEPRTIDFFAPAVVALLLQHLLITFAALSIIRDRRLGIVELFRVSPVSPAEVLIGKYLSYLLFGGILAAVFALIIVFALGVPMLGNWSNFALVSIALLFASLGIGFVISLAAQTESQAVQYSMIVLLASVFFSGFILNLKLLWEGVQAVSWTLPATYGVTLLQDVMLRGRAIDPLLLLGLLAVGALFFVIALVMMRRKMARL